MSSHAELELHRAALTGHCYRMLGSVVDADDAVQETMVRAWKSLDGFEGRASLRSWLMRIATNVCLDALRYRARRERPASAQPAGTPADPLGERPHSEWLEPIPDAAVIPADADPAEAAILRQSIRLAFVAALQHLPPRQRAALLLTKVLGWSAAEVAQSLDTSVASVNSAVQRARATLGAQALDSSSGVLTESESSLLDRFVDAFERYDIEALATLLRDDAIMSMPPHELWLQGPKAIGAWLLGRGSGCRGSKLIPTAANGLPAFGQYRLGEVPGSYEPWSLVVLEIADRRIVGLNHFLDTDMLFPRFGLPAKLVSPSKA